MPYEKKKESYMKYSKLWENDDNLKDCVRPIPSDEKAALCRYCKTTLRAHKRDLVDHAKTKKHIANSKPFSQSRTVQLRLHLQNNR